MRIAWPRPITESNWRQHKLLGEVPCIAHGSPWGTWAHVAGGDADGAVKRAVSGSMPDDFSGTWAHDVRGGVNPGRAKSDDKVFTITDGTVISLIPEAETAAGPDGVAKDGQIEGPSPTISFGAAGSTPTSRPTIG